METCEGGNPGHDPVIFSDRVACPVCSMEEYKDSIIYEKERELEEAREEIEDLSNLNTALTNDLGQYESIDDTIKQMIKERM